ncbi:Diaminopimelate epimerase [Sphingomonas antarctica]|uniref:diaminopimelate epimerase n=1 Tax=Sphingomonas antarctica TaxID=2040274 RepID=UPI0039E90ED2
MRFAFTKMHGLGNDFVVIDARETHVAIDESSARTIADRHTGIGCDQLILLEPSTTADAVMRIWNHDGSEVEACGNATRAVARLIGKPATVETAGGLLTLTPNDNGATVDLAAPRFAWDQIPLAYAMDAQNLPLAWDDLADPFCVNIGNPHAVFFVADVDAVDLARLGPLIEHDSVFPQRVNVGVAQVTGSASLKVRVWERGAGLTRACGTGACAAAIAAIKRKLVTSPVTVTLPGGDLTIAWDGGAIAMSGPATFVFSGTADIA